MNDEQPANEQITEKNAKLAYAQPVLREYGSVGSLTKGNTGTTADGSSPGARP
jgi:hypothetical protein